MELVKNIENKINKTIVKFVAMDLLINKFNKLNATVTINTITKPSFNLLLKLEKTNWKEEESTSPNENVFFNIIMAVREGFEPSLRCYS